MKILFYGDSITDAGRSRENPTLLGEGFPAKTALFLRESRPETSFSFLNLGISGNETSDLVQRLDTDLIPYRPELVVLLIGVNDVWHRVRVNAPINPAQIRENLLCIVRAIRNLGAKLLWLEPFLVAPSEWDTHLRPALTPVLSITRELAQTYADAFLPLDGLLAKESLKTAPMLLSEDGVHPAEAGRRFIGKLVAESILSLLDGSFNK